MFPNPLIKTIEKPLVIVTSTKDFFYTSCLYTLRSRYFILIVNPTARRDITMKLTYNLCA